MKKNLGFKGKLGIFALVAVMAGGASVYAASSTAEISEEQAKKIALSKVSGASESDITKVKKDVDDGREEFDIEIVFDGYEYDFEISVKDGKVFDQSKEKLDAEDKAELEAKKASEEKKEAASSSSESGKSSAVVSSSSSSSENSSSPESSSSAADIGLEKAKSIALGQVSGADSGDIVKAYKDHDDGRVEYDIEIRSGDHEYEFEIDAASGKILSKDVDRIEYDDHDDDDDHDEYDD